MSILLEALRKSEKDRRGANSPDIHAGELPEPVSRFWGKGLLLLLVIVAVSAIAWFAWHQYKAPDTIGQSPVAESPGKSTQAGPQHEELESGDNRRPPSVTSIAVANGEAEQPRTPVESFRQQANDGSKTQAAKAAEAKLRAKPYIISTPANQSADVGSNKTAAKQSGTAKPGSLVTAAGKAEDIEPTEADKKDFRPGPPAPIGYWDLPDAIRAVIPEIKFSVLVYASEVSDRFVLINGVRLREGEAVLAGLIVKEIRRDGVIFKYRLYEFLVER